MRFFSFLFLFFISSVVSAQEIKGTVMDAEGKILPFATILVAGTNKGATANNQGQYSLVLPAGNYTLDCRFVGYKSVEKKVAVKASVQTVDFQLSVQNLSLQEVVIRRGGEDPAYEIIRQAIKKRDYYDKQVTAFTAEIYIKGLIKLRKLPNSFMGKEIPEEDKNEMGLDSSGKGILYLSESVTRVYSELPDHFKLEVLSSRVSGSNGLGFDFPAFISFYKNNVNVLGGQLNPRGFISPIADAALNYYSYKLLGSFYEDGVLVNTIRVTPKREYEPLFSGIINITEGDWRIFSCNLLVTRKSQLQVLDSLQVSQIHMPVENDIWRIKNQVIHFTFDQFGIKAAGDFANVYSDYDLSPEFDKNFFNRVVIKYDSAVNKRTHEYWDTVRPIPLEPEEIKDYRQKDSALKVRLEAPPPSMDSLRKRQGPVTIGQVILTGINRRHFDSLHPYQVSIKPLITSAEFNTVEGLMINPSIVFSKYLKKWDNHLNIITDVRYGFNNRHLNPWAGITLNSNDSFSLDKEMKHRSFFAAGGKRVSQFFKQSDINGLGNTVGSLLYGRNEMKIYENYFGKAGYSKQWGGNAKLLIEAGYEDRLPLGNTTDFILNEKWRKRYTPNYPVEILSSQFTPHQSVAVHMQFTIKPGQRYIEFPTYRMAIGSKYPTFVFDYTKGIKNILGSDVDYDKWSLTARDEANLKIAGSIKYNVSIGGFLNNRAVYVQDYKHFYNNISTIAAEYVKAFQNVPHYRYSNVSPFYGELHFEHHANGLLTNKIPLFKKLNWTLVEGTNALFLNPKTTYVEVFAGIENIFKLIRVDVVAGLEKGYRPTYSFRIGFGGLLGDAANTLRFRSDTKIIDKW